MYSEKIAAKRLELVEASIRQAGIEGFSFLEHSVGEIEEFTERMLGVFDPKTLLPKRPLTAEEVLFITNELNLAKYRFSYFLSRYCSISSDQGRMTKVIPRTSQQKLLAKMAELEEQSAPLPFGKAGLAVVKARRVGATVIGQAAVAHGCMLRDQAMGLTASDTPENSLKLYQIQERIYDNLPIWMKPHMSGRVKADHLHFDALDSDIQVATGNQKNPMGQGVRLDFIHLTEMSTWTPEGTEQITEDVVPAFKSSRAPSTLMMLESTGKSALASGKWFENLCKEAQKGNNMYGLLFLSWFDVPEVHSQSARGVELIEETRQMAERVKRNHGVELTKDQMAWYQFTRKHYESEGKLQVFLQEFPEVLEDAWQSGLRSVFSIEVRERVRNNLRPLKEGFEFNFRTGKLHSPFHRLDSSSGINRLHVWERRQPGYHYVMGVDVSYGKEGKDLSAICINRVGTRSREDEQVAEFRGLCQPDELAKVCWVMGHLYSDGEGLPALAAIEVNPGSPGLITQLELQKLGYSNFYLWKKVNKLGGGYTTEMGWYTTPTTRPFLTKTGVEAVKRSMFQINSPFLLEEMRTYVQYEKSRDGGLNWLEHFEHAPDEHDDSIMAAWIALYVSHESDVQSVAEERRKEAEARTATAKPSLDFQNSDQSWGEGVSAWESRVGLDNFDLSGVGEADWEMN